MDDEKNLKCLFTSNNKQSLFCGALNKIAVILEQILCILDNPKFGLCETKEEIEEIIEGICEVLEELEKIEKDIKKIEKGINTITEAITSPEFGLQEIKAEVKELVDRTVVGNNLTTGPVIADVCAESLVVKILNDTPTAKTVTINVYNLDCCPKKICSSQTITLSGKCTEAIIFSKPPLDYQVDFIGMVPGVFAWTSTRKNCPDTDLACSEFIAANTFRHSELTTSRDP